MLLIKLLNEQVSPIFSGTKKNLIKSGCFRKKHISFLIAKNFQ